MYKELKETARGAKTRRRVKIARATRLLHQVFGDVEVRLTPKGTVDEVVLTKNGECLFHLEYMDRNHVWMSVGDLHVNLYSANSIRAEATVCNTARATKQR